MADVKDEYIIPTLVFFLLLFCVSIQQIFLESVNRKDMMGYRVILSWIIGTEIARLILLLMFSFEDGMFALCDYSLLFIFIFILINSHSCWVYTVYTCSIMFIVVHV